MKKIWNYFTSAEKLLWMASVILIVASYIIFGGRSYITVIASIIGSTFLILNAKGNPIGQFLVIVFGIMYGIISYSFDYYGEMITYLGMTAPMALFSLISWLRNPFEGNHAEVEVNRLQIKEYIFMSVLTVVVTVAFYYILDYFGTANMIPSTISVTTSFIAVYLTFRRDPYYAIGYAANDIVLIILWTMAAYENSSYISVVICFITFLAGDLYGFINWNRMYRRQTKADGITI